eukprot:Selendium_serpulae@DN2_c0_g1_i1.p1
MVVAKRFVRDVRPGLECASLVWSPHKITDIHKIERVQCRAVACVGALDTLRCEERRQQLGRIRRLADLFDVEQEEVGDTKRRSTKTTDLNKVKPEMFLARAVRLWHQLPRNIQTIHDRKTIKAVTAV